MADEHIFMKDISERDFSKIFFHIIAHKDSFGIRYTSGSVTPDGLIIAFERIFILSYLKSKEELIVTTHPKNAKGIRERFDHYLICDCKLNKQIIGWADPFGKVIDCLASFKNSGRYGGS